MRVLGLPLALAWLSGCPANPEPVVPSDADGDGVAAPLDCDDSDRAVYPDAAELCNGIDDDCDGEIDEDLGYTVYDDADGDGFGDASTASWACGPGPAQVLDGSDCDDVDDSVNPGTVEVCDDKDNDCNALVDDSPVDGAWWYADVDEDGFGANGSGRRECGTPEGLVSIDGDCSDAAPLVHPGRPDDDCNSIDNDCDGVVDDEAPAWYADTDSDGFGDPTAVTFACVQPSMHVAQAGDCDDSAFSVHPDAVENCDGVDEDCDGLVDNEPVDGQTYWLDADGDGFGDPAADGVACGRQPSFATNPDDCDDGDAAVRPSATEICDDGIDNDCDPSIAPCVHDVWLDDTPPALTGGSGSQLGWAMVPLDLDGNGVDELVVSAANSSAAAANGGHLTLWEGPFTGDDATQLIPTWTSTVVRDQLATDLVDMGDVSGDGLADLAAAVFSSDGDFVDGGGVYLFDEVGSGGTTDDARLHVHPVEASEVLGFALAGGVDLVGGAEADLVAGAYQWGSNTGYAAIFDGTTTGDVDRDDADAVIEGRAPGGESAGYALDLGDLNGDAAPEVAISAFNDEHPGGNSTGVVFVVEGPFTGVMTTGEAAAAIEGAADSDRFGWGILTTDLDGDGISDLVASSGYHDGEGTNAGAIYVFHGPIGNGLDDVSSADAKLSGVVDVDLQIGFASEIHAIGDVNGDGSPDLAANQTFVDSVTGVDDSGMCHIFYGPFSGAQSAYDASVGRIQGSNGSRPWPCQSATALGDQNGDGVDDFAIGVPFWDVGNSGDVGGVWFIEGRTL